MVQISIDGTPHLFTIRLTTFDALVQYIIRRVGIDRILPLSYFDQINNEFVLLRGNDIELFRGMTHVRLSLGHTESAVYEGDLNSEGKRHGQGLYRWPNGRTYLGEWYDNEMDGEGVESWPNGSKYEGQFKGNKRHGQGTFTWKDGRQYMGEYRNDLRHGYGVCTFPNGYKYEGQWREGKKNGYGIEIFPDGHRYSGQFKDDKAVAPS